MRVARTAGSRQATSGYRRMIPELQVRDRAFQVLLKLGTRFGLDPSSREGLGVANQTSPDFAEEFLFKPRVVPYTHLRAHETEADPVCRLLLEKKK